MKTRTSPGLFLTVTITAVLILAARNVPAQDSTTSAAQTAPAQLSYGVSQIIQLSKAKVSDDTIVNYIRNSGSSYGLDASQIVYLKQQGISDTVINTMLNQPRPAAPAASSPAPATMAVQPAVTYVQTAPAYVPSSTVYVIPDTQTYRYYNSYYYPSYGYYYPYYSGWYYPSVSFSFGFGGGYHGGYYHGGWGGYHGGGGWHR